MNLEQMATHLLHSKLGGKADARAVQAVIDDLLGGTDGMSPLSALVGDIDADQFSLPTSQIAEFADRLGINQRQAMDRLANFLPELVSLLRCGPTDYAQLTYRPC